MTSYNHLCKEQRNTIEHLLNLGFHFSYIANAINTDRTTISKEIRRNRSLKSKVNLPFNTNGIENAIKACKNISNPPYCCNYCSLKSSCLKNHIYYNAKNAQSHYEHILTSARQGIDISKEEIDIINKNIVPLVKFNKQSVNQIFINHPDLLAFSKPTFYKYVNNNVIDLNNLDLARKVKYKKRKRKANTKNKRNFAILIKRRYEDYLERTSQDKNLLIWQLDTVIGRQTESKVLMTFLLVETNFMIIRLLDKKDVEHVDNEFTKIKIDLGIDLYSRFINIILTDNGIEFYDPHHMEYNLDNGEKISSVYYCHPNSPQEKSELEKNHEYIRYVLPKKTSFESLTEKKVKLLEDNINNIPRDILGNETPYNLTKEKYPELIEKFGSNYIQPDEVSLNSESILGDNDNAR